MQSMKKQTLLSLMMVIGIGSVTMLSGCAMAQTGERFGIDMSSRISQPKLADAVLISDDKRVRVEGVNAGVNYGVSNGTQVPNEVEFIWRAAGEKETHLEKIKLRSQIPRDVLIKIGGLRPMYSLSIEFFVRDNTPLFRWRLTEIPPGQTSNFKEIGRGGNW